MTNLAVDADFLRPRCEPSLPAASRQLRLR